MHFDLWGIVPRNSLGGKSTNVKITRIFAHRVELPFVGGEYKWSGGKSVGVFDSTIVGVETDTGKSVMRGMSLGTILLAGLCRWGTSRHSRASASSNRRRSARAIQTELSYGCSTQGTPLCEVWNRHCLLGHSRQSNRLPVCVLMGGRFGDSVRLYRAISQQSPDEMAIDVAEFRSQGYTRFQLKVWWRSRSGYRTYPASSQLFVSDRPACCRRKYGVDTA